MLGHFFLFGGQVLYGRDDSIRWGDSWIGKVYAFVKKNSGILVVCDAFIHMFQVR